MRSTAARFFAMDGGGPESGTGRQWGVGGRHGAAPALATTARSVPRTSVPNADDTLSRSDGHGPAERFPRAHTVPRPVTVKQVITGVAGGTEYRVGASTILLDGLPCCHVTLCGRVLSKQGPHENGSLARFLAALSQQHLRPPHAVHGLSVNHRLDHSLHLNSDVPLSGPPASFASGQTSRAGPPHPYSVYIMTDATGSLGVLQHHSILYDCAETDDEASQPACFADHAHQSTLPAHTDTEGGEGPRYQATPSAFHNPSIPAEELDVMVNDYIVVSGRLAFADVEGGTFDCCFAGLPAFSAPPRTLPPSTFTVREPVLSTTGSEDAAACPGTGAPYTHVVLPGAEVAMPLMAFCNAFGFDPVAAPPPGARFLTAREEEDDEAEGEQSRCFHEAAAASLSCCTTANDAATASATAAAVASSSSSSSPPPGVQVCVRGRVRLAHSSDEIAYWSLSALETHLRLRRRKAHGPAIGAASSSSE